MKTFRLSFAGRNKVEEMPQADVALPWNKRCFSYNEFRNAADFDGGCSYAAELVPGEGITVDGVRFGLQDMDGMNGYACGGDTVALPEGRFNRLYFLAASTRGDNSASVEFLVQDRKQSRCVKSSEFLVPDYNAFIGQWGHEGQTTGYMKEAQVAYVGTHRHSAVEDEPYEFTYMFKCGVDIPEGARQIVLPKNKGIVIFGMKAVSEAVNVEHASRMFRTANRNDERGGVNVVRTNLLKAAKIIDKTGEVNADEVAGNMIDGDSMTKWCDVNDAPNYVAFDLGEEKTFSAWHLLSAGAETTSYITRSRLLQVRNSLTEEWKTIDILDGNKQNDVVRTVTPTKSRYVRLYITAQTQTLGHDAARIYEFELFE